MSAARHQRHAGVRLLKVGQAVADLDADERQLFVTEIFGMRMSRCQPRRNGGASGALRTFVDDVVECRWMFGLSSWTTSGTVVEFATSASNAFSLSKPRRRSRWLYSGLPASSGLLRMARESIGFFGERLFDVSADPARSDDEKAVLRERSALFFCERHEVHTGCFPQRRKGLAEAQRRKMLKWQRDANLAIVLHDRFLLCAAPLRETLSNHTTVLHPSLRLCGRLFLITQQCCISSFTGGRIVACGNNDFMYSTE
jgi:hypothetical protein